MGREQFFRGVIPSESEFRKAERRRREEPRGYLSEDADAGNFLDALAFGLLGNLKRRSARTFTRECLESACNAVCILRVPLSRTPQSGSRTHGRTWTAIHLAQSRILEPL